MSLIRLRVIYGYICSLSTEWYDTFSFVQAQIASGSSTSAGVGGGGNLAHVSLELRHAWPVAFFEVDKKPS